MTDSPPGEGEEKTLGYDHALPTSGVNSRAGPDGRNILEPNRGGDRRAPSGTAPDSVNLPVGRAPRPHVGRAAADGRVVRAGRRRPAGG